MTFERTEDAERVCRILTERRCWETIRDDFTEAPDFRPNADSRIWYVIAREDGRDLGLFIFVPRNTVLWEWHVAVLPWAWGFASRRAGRQAIEWFFEQTQCERLIGEIAEFNRCAIAYAQAMGMQQYGRNPRSFARHGRLWDVVLFGLSRGLEHSAWR